MALECICVPALFPERETRGRYLLPNDNSKRPVQVRLVGKAVMVRVGGGWETLRAVLRPHDPCRKDSQTSYFRKIYDQFQVKLDEDIKASANLDGHPALFTTRRVS